MWGNGGRFYWGRKEKGGEGIVVVFACLSSQEMNLQPYIDLYGSLGWNSLICHVDFLTLFFPAKSTSLACGVLSELVKEVKVRALPIVLTSFSGGSKGCLCKVIQLVEGKCEGQLKQDDYQLVRNCISGQVYDSSPTDFRNYQGFILHPSFIKKSHPPRVISWMVKTLASGLDTLFINKFEAERADYWQTLYSSVSMGPFLILCSENDELTPYQLICSFAQRLQELGGDVKLVKWSSSPCVDHYKHHPDDYKAAVTEFLTKAAVIYSQRRQFTVSSNESLKIVAIEPSDHFFLPSSMDFSETKEAGSLPDEQNGDSPHLPRINPHGVLSQILFDVCVPRNIEGWDIKSPGSVNGRRTFASGRRYGQFNPIKYIRRSRL